MGEYICGFCNVWVSVFVGFLIFGSFNNSLCLGNRFLYLFRFCIVSFMYIYSYLLIV